MGAGPFRLSDADFYTADVDTTPNPNKYNFKILEIVEGEVFDIVRVRYPNCTTFEGVKILVVYAGSIAKDCTELDPHFFKDGPVVARFAPTIIGCWCALELARGSEDLNERIRSRLNQSQ